MYYQELLTISREFEIEITDTVELCDVYVHRPRMLVVRRSAEQAARRDCSFWNTIKKRKSFSIEIAHKTKNRKVRPSTLHLPCLLLK